ncbi:MAG: hypothetical protein DMG65_25695 [Candidatus Angelobacter sp. Gp1-AA117]|nr:MAG: hypothetical protein DMG65_25695 [Candidatus Angelobacter sp. Gp1-AA117]
MNSALRPMSTGEVLDRTFYLYRNNFILFAGITLVASIFSLCVRLAMLFAFGSEAAQGSLQRSPLLFLVTLVIYVIAYLVVHSLASGATVHAVSLVHLGRSASIHQSYSEIKSLFFRIFNIVVSVFIRAIGPTIIIYALLFGVALSLTRGARDNPGSSAVIAGALMALVLLLVLIVALVWMIRTFARYAFAVPACAIEKVSAGDALKRSKFLTKKSIGRVVLVFLLTGLIAVALGYVFQLPVYLAHGTFWMTPSIHLSLPYVVGLYIADFLAGSLAGPIATIAIALLYYDERIRKEAFDLQWMMQSIEPAANQAATAAVPGTGAIQ